MDAWLAGLQGEFTPQATPRVVFGRGALARLGDELDALGVARAFVVSGPSVADKTDLLSRVRSILGKRWVGQYSGLSMRAPLPRAVEAARSASDLGCDALVGVGGSTVSDAARVVAFMVKEGALDAAGVRALGELLKVDPPITTGMVGLATVVHVPTTLSGGEFSIGKGRVLDEEAGEKIKIDHPGLHTDLVILDPEATRRTPDWLWYSTGVKALDHAIERLYARNHQPATDAPVLMAAELVFRNLQRSGGSSGDLDARLGCQVAAWLSMMGVPNNLFGLSHAIGHAIGIRYGVPHGYTSCVTQPHVMAFNRPASAAKQAMLARAIGIDMRAQSDEAAAAEAARAVDRFIGALGMPRRIRDLDIPRDALGGLAEHVARNPYAHGNPIPVTRPEQAMEVLELAW